MRLDKFNNPIFNETDIFDILYQGNISVLSHLFVDSSQELTKLEQIGEFQFNNITSIDNSISIHDFDIQQQKQWFIPENYQSIDIKSFCLDKCKSIEEHNRVLEELEEYNNLGMIDLLQWCIYFVDTCTNNNILWGVGRGSSVASYVLYLIGIHRINSIKYNLDWKEFLR